MRTTTVLSTLKPLAVAVVAVSALALAAPAHATVMTFTLNEYVGTGTPTTAPPFGWVELNDNGGANVTVTLTLASDEGLVNTGAGDSLTFDLSGVTLTSADIMGLPTGFMLDTSSPVHTGGAGDFDYGIACSTACGHGGNAPYMSALSFTIDNVTLGDFIANGNGNFFASDICLSVDTTKDKCNAGALTGDIAGNQPGTTTSVPEPATLALFAAGLAGLGFAVGRRRKNV